MARPEALSALESAFLHLERGRNPIHIGTIAVLEGPPLRDPQGRLEVGRIREHIEGRLHLAPKLRRRIRHAVLPGAPSVWIDDPEFDIANHVSGARLDPPGSMDQLLELGAELLGTPLDPDRPLWHFLFVDGLEGDRVGVVERIHHAMADGLAGVEMATVLLDLEPHDRDGGSPAAGGAPWRPEAQPWLGREAVHDLVRLNEIGWRWVGRGLRAARHPLGTAQAAVRLGGAVTALTGTGLGRASTSLNRPIGEERRVSVVREPLRGFAEVAHAFDVTLNDVVLTVIGGAVARLLDGRGERPPAEVQVLVPVGLEPVERHGLGNRVSAWLVKVPADSGDPVGRLSEVAVATGGARVHHEELAAEALLDLVAPLPQPLVAAAVRLVDHQPLINLIVTNVPGPPFPLYVLGSRMLEAYPFVPVAGNLTLGVAVLSYDGWLALGILADAATCPDVAIFAQGIEEQLGTLRQAIPARIRPEIA
jgi:WS/DGAT/MGAT family acyltransferase